MKISEKKMQIVIDNYFDSECSTDTSIREAFERGFRLGAKKVAASTENKWIPVSEKNPSQTGEYLVTTECEDGATFTDKFGYTPTTDGGWYDPEVPSQTYIDWNKHITAWQPMPAPYKGGDTE